MIGISQKRFFSLALLHGSLTPARETEALQLDFQMYCEALNFLSCHKDSSKGLNSHQGCEQEQPGEQVSGHWRRDDSEQFAVL